MKGISHAVLIAFLLFDALLETAAAFPVSPPGSDVALLRPSNTSLGPTKLVTFTKLVLAVNDLGQDIPKEEVEGTLRGAELAIQYEVGTHPEQRIPGDEFGYRRRDGNMLIFIAANIEEEITWSQLSRVLHALNRYMTGGTGVPEEHYQALDFEIRTLSHRIVGFGMVRYFPPNSSRAQRRAWLPPSSSTVHRTNLQLPTLVNGRNRTANTTSVLSTYVEYPIPNSPVTLIITNLGVPIPSFELGAGLTNALRKIRISRDSHAHNPIPANNYWYRDNISHVWLSVVSITSHVITWQQLSWAVAGLLQWMKDDDCRELAFEFEVISEGVVGSGSVGYDPLPRSAPSHTTKVKKRTAAGDETFLQLPGNATVSSNSSPVGECTVIPDVSIDLCFRSSDLQIPAYEVNRMFDGASARISTLHGKDPQDRVPNNSFSYRDVFISTGDSKSVPIQRDPRVAVLWIGLQKTLAGLWVYTKGIRPRITNQDPYDQNLEFDIITYRTAKMGTGWVEHTSKGSQIGAIKRRTNANDTVQQLNVGAVSLPDIDRYGRVLVSGATNPDLAIYFRYHGEGISPSYIDALFAQALLDFPVSEELVPGTSFHLSTPYSKTDGATSLTINWLSSYRMTYNTLQRVLLGLQRYVNGDYDKRLHSQDLESELTAHGGGIGSGILWYVSGEASSGKRGLSASAVRNENLLLLSGDPNSTLPHEYNSTLWLLEAPFPFPVPGSPITLSISRRCTPLGGIGIELFDVLASALTDIGPVIEAHPGALITQKAYKRSKLSEQGGLELNVHADGDCDISWQDLKDVILGLEAFYGYNPETGWDRSFASRFDIYKAGKGIIGSGNLTLVGSAVA